MTISKVMLFSEKFNPKEPKDKEKKHSPQTHKKFTMNKNNNQFTRISTIYVKMADYLR